MTLKSALDDVLDVTLSAVSGIVGKLEYFSSLRERPNSYSHWGLAKVYGEGVAQKALAEAHSAFFLVILRTSLRTLRDDVEVSSREKQKPADEYVEDLRSRLPSLLPSDLGGGSARHFSSVLHALSSLASNQAKTRPHATHPS
jgi:uncharacterized protein YbgA (DUF1722 family)